VESALHDSTRLTRRQLPMRGSPRSFQTTMTLGRGTVPPGQLESGAASELPSPGCWMAVKGVRRAWRRRAGERTGGGWARGPGPVAGCRCCRVGGRKKRRSGTRGRAPGATA